VVYEGDEVLYVGMAGRRPVEHHPHRHPGGGGRDEFRSDECCRLRTSEPFSPHLPAPSRSHAMIATSLVMFYKGDRHRA
jgi:hypothetical protein